MSGDLISRGLSGSVGQIDEIPRLKLVQIIERSTICSPMTGDPNVALSSDLRRSRVMSRALSQLGSTYPFYDEDVQPDAGNDQATEEASYRRGSLLRRGRRGDDIGNPG